MRGADAYVRGTALLRQGRSGEATDVFDAMIRHRGPNWGPEYPAAYVGLARAAARAGDTARAKKAYEGLFALWKDADPDVPLLVAARKEYAAFE
jgi:Flp pilus assembly protein TadD